MRAVAIILGAMLLLLLFPYSAYAHTYHSITCDGNMDDWSEDESMGTVNSATFYITFDFYNIYFGFHRGSTDNDMFIALDVKEGGANKSLNWYGQHELPFDADYYIAIENESYAYLLKYSNNNWTEYRSLKSLGGYIKDWNVNIELKIPLNLIGYPKKVNVIAYGQWENAVNVWSVWPTTNPMGKGEQNFSNYISLPIKAGIHPSDYKYGVKFAKPKFNIDGYLTDWSGDSNLTKIEDSSEDSAGDLENVVENEVYELYVTWDDNYLYVGYEYRTGVWGDSKYDNGTMVFIDSDSPWNDGTTSLDHMNVWPRKIDFGNFRCEFFYGKWDEQKGNFYHVLSENFSQDISYDFIVATTGGNGVRGDVEMAIPWYVLYGKNYKSAMYNTTGVKISLAVVGHDNETALDTIPDVGDVTKNTNCSDEVTIDYFYNTGKIFSPEPLKIENLTYNFNGEGVNISWETNRDANTTLTFESNGAYKNYSFEANRTFIVEIMGVTNDTPFNITVKAEDIYGNIATEVLEHKVNEKNEGNETKESGGKIDLIYVSILVAGGIIIVGEVLIYRRRKR